MVRTPQSQPLRTFNVVPTLPPALEGLRELAYNLRWSWNHDAVELFQRLDPERWQATHHNPVRLLGEVSQARLDDAARDEGFLAQLRQVLDEFAAYQGEDAWFARTHGRREPAQPLVAYFSAEFGLTECLTIFAGGLGLLAGDHLKSASDLGVPLVGVGLLYQQGYFQQRLNEGGWQEQVYVTNDFHTLPLTLVRQADGDAPLTVALDFPGRVVRAQVWRAQVGRVALYLLDTNVAGNAPDDRNITDQLYGGDLDTRIRQEIVLGIGGCRALEALGLQPAVYHMNEGHSAFLALERIRRLMERDGLAFGAAREIVSAGLIFTTHTPVPAGHDAFPAPLMEHYFGDYATALGLSMPDFLALGRVNPADEHELFGMTTLALRLAARGNGVSRLHGEVSREMWQPFWPGVPRDDIPIGSVTNGVHFETWISHHIGDLYNRYLGPRWRRESADETVWRQVEHIPAEELWATHERQRDRLVAYARRHAQAQLRARRAPRAEIAAAGEMLDPRALTIGFARRFATYKRATLLFRDPERLARILSNPERPVQLIVAGKAHPRDDAGKELIRQIVAWSRTEPFRGRVLFLENYDTEMARALVQGSDVWLNNPRRPLEASGTSGMKALANGVLNLSTLDGWWDEAWDANQDLLAPIGWAIGQAGGYLNNDEQDAIDAESLYATLEREVVPAFYERGPDGVPARWVAMMRSSIGSLCQFFNTHRMVHEYTERFYLPAAEHHQRLLSAAGGRANDLAAWRERVTRAWPKVRVVAVETPVDGVLQVGEPLSALARVELGGLTPDDVSVELALGRVDADGALVDADIIPMQLAGVRDGAHEFRADTATPGASGLHGFSVRVLPRHADLEQPFLPGLIAWAE